MAAVLDTIDGILWGWVVTWLLLGAGIYFTIRLKGVQFRYLGHMVKVMLGSRNNDGESISSFQAFATGLAARVGTGNIAGVGVALYNGGPGAVFWMWVISLIGMCSSFVETILAQVYKFREADGTFRGGPAYVMRDGLKLPWLGVVFSLLLMLAYGLVFNSVQSNSISEAANKAFGLSPTVVAVVLAVGAGAVVFGGIKRIGAVAEILVPSMAVLYLLVAFAVSLYHFDELPRVLGSIIKGAFADYEIGAGLLGYAVKEAMMNGVRRGLFSNEAGMGSTPNVAAAADVKHPVEQGFVQMLGVFTDTVIVCSSTASFILLGDKLRPESELTGVALTQESLAALTGDWALYFISISLFLFAFTSIVANYYFGETALSYITESSVARWIFRMAVLGMVVFGVFAEVPVVWQLADVSMGFMVLVNLFCLLMMFPVVQKVWEDYQRQLHAGVEEPTFNSHEVLGMDSEVWGTKDDRDVSGE